MGVATPDVLGGENIHGRGTLAKKVGQIIPKGSAADERKPQVLIDLCAPSMLQPELHTHMGSVYYTRPGQY
jgi:hypothetical protein